MNQNESIQAAKQKIEELFRVSISLVRKIGEPSREFTDDKKELIWAEGIRRIDNGADSVMFNEAECDEIIQRHMVIPD